MQINAFAFETCITVDNVEYELDHHKYSEGEEYHVVRIVDTNYDGSDIDVVIPDEINGVPVTCIRSGAFASSHNIASVSIGNNVKVIEEKAFSGTRLTSIHLSDSVEKIGSYAFSRCLYLRSFVSGMGLKELGENVFYDTARINVVIPDSIKLNENYDPNLLNVVSLDDILREEQQELSAQIEDMEAQLENKLNRLDAINAFFNESTHTASGFGDGNVTLIIIGAVLIVAALGIGLLIGKKLPAKKRT